MNPMVLKYVGLTGIVYGIHVYLAISQILLGIFLVTNGTILLTSKKNLSIWATRLGLVVNEWLGKKSINGWFMITTGIALLLPLLGFPFWLTIIACPISVYWILALKRGTAGVAKKKTGGFVQKALMASAVVIFCFTIWEGKDLVRAGFVVTYKAAYWDYKEVQGWQKKNNPNVPKVGELAADFVLTDVHGKSTIRLSDFRGNKPVVLLFGSFT